MYRTRVVQKLWQIITRNKPNKTKTQPKTTRKSPSQICVSPQSKTAKQQRTGQGPTKTKTKTWDLPWIQWPKPLYHPQKQGKICDEWCAFITCDLFCSLMFLIFGVMFLKRTFWRRRSRAIQIWISGFSFVRVCVNSVCRFMVAPYVGPHTQTAQAREVCFAIQFERSSWLKLCVSLLMLFIAGRKANVWAAFKPSVQNLCW